MSIMELGALGEFFGAIAVITTLIYVAIQVKHSRDLLEENRKIALSQVFQNRATQRMEHLRFLAGDPHLATVQARIEVSGTNSVVDLSNEERVRLRSFYNAQLQGMDNVIYQTEIGLLCGDDVEQGVKSTFSQNVELYELLQCPISSGLRRWYEESGGVE